MSRGTGGSSRPVRSRDSNYNPPPPVRSPQSSVISRAEINRRQEIKFTPWALNLTSETHKCCDLNLFQTPKPEPPTSLSITSQVSRRSTVRSSNQRTQGTGRDVQSRQPRRNPLRRGTVVLPILPGPKRRMPFFDVSVMTLSNVLYTPGKKYSELSWKVLEEQGFTRHVLHEGHSHEVIYRSREQNARQYIEDANRVSIAGGLVTLEGSLGQGRICQGGHRFMGHGHISIIRHPAIPDVDLLWCVSDESVGPGLLSVRMNAAAMVDLRAWSWGVENGIVGKGAGFRANDPDGDPVAWVVRYGGDSPYDEPVHGDTEDLFRRIVQGGVSVGRPLVREMESGR